MSRLLSIFAAALGAATLLAAPAAAQVFVPPADDDVLVLTLDEAVEVALLNSYEVQRLRLDVANADAQVREAWGLVMPQVDASASYTRNLKTANPFAGSDAGGLFETLGLIEWLGRNERARTDDDPTTVPISLQEFLDSLPEPDANADANPFNVPNQFSSGVTVEQTVFNGSAFAAIQGAQRLKDLNRRTLDRGEQLVVDRIRTAYYTALLAQEQARVSALGVARTQETLDDVARRVVQGVTPKFQRLSAEVELANRETQLVSAEAQAASALDNLKLVLGIPIGETIRLRGALDVPEQDPFLTVSVEDAVATAFRSRADLEAAGLAVEIREIDRKITAAGYLPRLSVFANANYIGNVPDTRDNRFFSQSYWNPSVNAGFRLSWNLFDGFQTSAQVQQRRIAVERAQVEREELVQAIWLEVEAALRDLRAARARIASQEQNVGRAETNYGFVQTRLREGVATPLEEREASEQLDVSRLNLLQAVSDYLVARSAFETAVGTALPSPADTRLTSN